MANDMGDLRRYVDKGRASAKCLQCGFGAPQFHVVDVLPETAGARARKHTRETGHRTVVQYTHYTTYTAVPRG